MLFVNHGKVSPLAQDRSPAIHQGLNKMVTWVLTDRQAERIRLILWGHDDEGPRDEGWPSAELEKIRAVVGCPVTWGDQDREGVDFDSLLDK
jgi:hypothetical protein